MKLGRELLKMVYGTKLGREFIKIPIKSLFRGGFAVDADFSDAFSGSIEGPFFRKNPKFR
jgi:hypothetical protein